MDNGALNELPRCQGLERVEEPRLVASHCTEVSTRSICNAPAALRASRSGQDLAPALPRRLSTVIIIITTCFPNYDPRAGG